MRKRQKLNERTIGSLHFDLTSVSFDSSDSSGDSSYLQFFLCNSTYKLSSPSQKEVSVLFVAENN